MRSHIDHKAGTVHHWITNGDAVEVDMDDLAVALLAVCAEFDITPACLKFQMHQLAKRMQARLE